VLLALATVLISSEFRILFLGNSHTLVNDIPGQVKSILESDGSKRKVTVSSIAGGALEALSNQPDALKAVSSGQWDVVILQGAALSSSHKYVYSQAGAIKLAKLAEASKARTLLYAEWPRKGWDETGYILGIYGQIAKASGAEIIPVCSAWDAALRVRKDLELWSSDGNHSSPIGGYLAALTIADFLGAGESNWTPFKIDAPVVKLIRRSARTAVRR
jgi:hypothetical protein